MDTPVLLLIFNRPETTALVFERIRQQRPSRLFIAADGPRAHIREDAARCQAARDVVSNVDWECEVKTLYREKNLGCGDGVSEAISWFFANVEAGIILEDDCLPAPDFFRFCSELLAHYKDDTRVMQIGGNNFVPAERRDERWSYYFSNHNYIWGWASWRRAWNLYSYTMAHYPEVTAKGYLRDYYASFGEDNYFAYVFRSIFHEPGRINTWDYQWQFSRMINAGLCVVPRVNLVVNLGFGNDSTHTDDASSYVTRLKHESIDFPLVHPDFVMADRKLDSLIFNHLFTTRWMRVRSRLHHAIRGDLSTAFNKLWRLSACL